MSECDYRHQWRRWNFYGDEETALAPEQHRIEVPQGCHWSDVIEMTKDVGKALKAAFLGIERLNNRLYGIFGDALWTNKERLPDHTLPNTRRTERNPKSTQANLI